MYFCVFFLCLISFWLRYCAREPEDGLRWGERPGIGNVFRRGAVSNRRLSEEPHSPADLHGGETHTRAHTTQ